MFVVVFLVLGYLGTQPATATASEIGLRCAELYFMFFLVLWLAVAMAIVARRR